MYQGAKTKAQEIIPHRCAHPTTDPIADLSDGGQPFERDQPQ